MGRYRPPQPRSSPHMTKDGFDALQAELKYLWKEKRPEVTAKVSEAAALGDRSENAEYIYGKKRLRQIDKRAEWLTRRLDVLQIVDPPRTTDRVQLLSYVEVENPDGDVRVFRIVGADETDAKAGWISWRSPVGRALIGKAVDDDVVVDTPGGRREYVVLDIARRPSDLDA